VRTAYSMKARNRELQRELLKAAASPQLYQQAKLAASDLLSGRITPATFVSRFKAVYGTSSSAISLLAKLVDMLPHNDLQRELRCCAGMSPAACEITQARAEGRDADRAAEHSQRAVTTTWVASGEAHSRLSPGT
jgi:hypothetical protein